MMALEADRELRGLRRHLGRIRRGRGRRFPAGLRTRIITWCVARHAQGAEWAALASALGITARTLQRWTPPDRTPPVALRPVTVLDAPPARALTVVTPHGLRVEGVTVADVIAIVRGLS